MSSLQDLNDPNKTCIYLPAAEDDVEATPDPTPSSRDLPNGCELRLEAYRIAWQKCLSRVQDIVRNLHAPIVSTVTKNIRTAYAESAILPGLPYAELPVVAVSGTNIVISDIVDTLTRPDAPTTQPKGKGKGRVVANDEEPSEEHTREVEISHVYPGDCPNLLSTMKAIITSFVDGTGHRSEEDKYPARVKRKATTSLTSYDVNLLRVWYSALLELRDEPPLLVVLLHDFERMDPNVMQDVFYIFSRHIPSLPLVFVLAMSTPSPSAYLHSVFQRSCLALLRLRVHTVPYGRSTVEEVIQRTFFDVDFEPDITLGTGVLGFLATFCMRHTPLLDAAISVLQIAHLKHFEEPLTALVHNSTLERTAQSRKHVFLQENSFAFLDSLLSQLYIQDDNASDDERPSTLQQSSNWKKTSVESLVQSVDNAREEFHQKARRMRLAYQVFRRVQQALEKQGIKFSVPSAQEETPLEFMSRFVRGKVSRDVNHLALIVKKLSNTQLEVVLSELYSLFYNLPTSLRWQETSSREFITQVRSDMQDGSDSTSRDPASSVGEWLKSYISVRIVRLDEGFLWQVWNTGSTPFPSELINPAPRMTIVNALLHPDEIVKEFEALTLEADEQEQEHEEDPHTLEIWELPDTSILFRRYMEAGKMINVYDWYESFALELDRQRREDVHKSLKSKAKRKKQKEPEKLTEQEQEKWEVETHARFIRALHELDFMGFIQHTGRKADHIRRTVYDLPD